MVPTEKRGRQSEEDSAPSPRGSALSETSEPSGPATPWDVLGIGCAAVDELLYVPGHPARDTRMRIVRSERRCGGLTATALIAASRLGSRCAYAGTLGHDPQSEFICAALAAEGIDLTPTIRRADARPIHSRILVDTQTGSRTILYEVAGKTGADQDIPAELVLGARVLLLDQYGAVGAPLLVETARRTGVPVVADFDGSGESGFEELLRLVDHLILGEEFALQVTRAPDAAAAVAALWSDERELVAVTAGNLGCWYRCRESPGRVQLMPAFRVTPVDTTGCGDVFHGAYASSLAQGLPVEERLQIASAAAALKASRCMIPGGEDVTRFLQGQLTEMGQ